MPSSPMKKLIRLRQIAFQRQCGLCIYCGLPMIPQEALSHVSAELALKIKRAKGVTATAEHLRARCDGGTDTEVNVAAAHYVCNVRRHRLNPVPSPEVYTTMVQTKMARGGWLERALRQRLEAVAERRSW